MQNENSEVIEARPRVRHYVAALKSRQHGPDFSFGEGDADEYMAVRKKVVIERAERAYADIHAAEQRERGEIRSAYVEETFDLKWVHRQTQLADRVAFGKRESNARGALSTTEETERLALCEAAVVDLVDVHRLEEHRRGDKIRQQTATLKAAVEAAEREAFEREKLIEDAWQRETTAREEARARNAIADAEHQGALRLWGNGHHALAQFRLEERESRGRRRVIKDEEWTRNLELRTAHVMGMLISGEAFYRAKIQDYEEPRRRDNIEQRFLRERDFAVWQSKLHDVQTRWAGEHIPGWQRTPRQQPIQGGSDQWSSDGEPFASVSLVSS